MSTKSDIKTCPTCGSRRIRQVTKSVTREFRGRKYTVPNLTYHECSACGEHVFSPEAMKKIESHRSIRGKSAA